MRAHTHSATPPSFFEKENGANDLYSSDGLAVPAAAMRCGGDADFLFPEAAPR